jgi:hypothetical protein
MMKAKILVVATTLTLLVTVPPTYAASYNFTTPDYPWRLTAPTPMGSTT